MLVHKGTPGLHIGDHHEPIGDPFPNGPIIGKDVVVPADNIVGGAEGAGQGWRMLMEQLAGGRAISLPAGAVGGAKSLLAVTGAYSMVRQQFGLPIGRMEGVEDKVGKIAGLTYALEGARVYACSAIDNGQQPPVISAILKAYTTETRARARPRGMDVFAGAGVMQGPNNIVGKGYSGAPVAITVEGANIMTRTFMIFGQGATRCHPYAQKVLKAMETRTIPPRSAANLLGWIGHFLGTIGRTFVRTLTRGLTAGSPVDGADRDLLPAPGLGRVALRDADQPRDVLHRRQAQGQGQAHRPLCRRDRLAVPGVQRAAPLRGRGPPHTRTCRWCATPATTRCARSSWRSRASTPNFNGAAGRRVDAHRRQLDAAPEPAGRADDGQAQPPRRAVHQTTSTTSTSAWSTACSTRPRRIPAPAA